MGHLQTLVGVASAIGAAFLGLNPFLVPFAFVAGYAASGGHRYVYAVCKTFPRDVFVIRKLLGVKGRLAEVGKRKIGVQHVFRETAAKYPDRVAVVLGTVEWTFSELENYANQIGHCFFHLGIRKSDAVAIFMENKPEVIGSWLGLSRLGTISAMINTNLRNDPLMHCITASKAKAIIIGLELKNAIADIKDRLEENQIQVFVIGDRGAPTPTPSDLDGVDATILDENIASQPTSPPEQTHPDTAQEVSVNDLLFYIFTSGTTGLPKPSKITHQRFLLMAYSLSMYNNMNKDTVLYCPLPLYHTNGSVLATGTMVFMGAKLVLRRKFSASNFWDDCIQHQCTAMIYIGECCRFLLAQPARDVDTRHKINLAMGNGLKKSMWERFVNRFKIERICEFYGATEANCNMANPFGRVGAVGFNSVIAPSVYPILLVRVNTDTGEEIRDRNGLCIRCNPGEPGEILGKIVDTDPLRRFDGYLDEEATRRKIVYDVLERGDKYFRSGDILVQDDEGYYYFMDRTGDTFRWKGENVSTAEVEGQIQRLMGLRDVVVYGVQVPGCDGRAGMAAIVGSQDATDGGLDLVDLRTRVKDAVPSYAAPVFLRIIPEAELTGTYKLKKVALTREGFNLDDVGDDPVYIALPGQGSYQRLEKDSELYDKIKRGEMRL